MMGELEKAQLSVLPRGRAVLGAPFPLFTPLPAPGLGHDSWPDASEGGTSWSWIIRKSQFKKLDILEGLLGPQIGANVGGVWRVGNCTSLDTQKVSSNPVLNSSFPYWWRLCSTLPLSSGRAIFDWSLFWAGKLVVSQSECGLHCLLRILFSCLQGTGHTKPVAVTPTDLHLASSAFYVGMIERLRGLCCSSPLDSDCPLCKSSSPFGIRAYDRCLNLLTATLDRKCPIYL